MIILKDDKKELLFEREYVNAKNLDAAVYPGWKDYFIKNFDWMLAEEQDRYGFNILRLVEKRSKETYYRIGLNLDNRLALQLDELR